MEEAGEKWIRPVDCFAGSVAKGATEEISKK
jgi:hypothetical protein